MNFIRNLARAPRRPGGVHRPHDGSAAEPTLRPLGARRYAKDEIYTFCGPLLVAVNLYRELPALYTAGSLDQHAQLLPSDGEPPHMLVMARAHARPMRRAAPGDRHLGESGAGKTETAKFSTENLCVASAGEETLQVRAWPPPPPPSPPPPPPPAHHLHHFHLLYHLLHLQARVMGSNPIMESFGCAQTVRNDNSSRFGTSCCAPHCGGITCPQSPLTPSHRLPYMYR